MNKRDNRHALRECVCVCHLSNHLVLVGIDEARQAAGQRRSNQLTYTHGDQASFG